jgi:two-component system OmpR family response regulator
MIISDEQVVTAMLKDILEQEDYSVSLVADASSALKLLGERKPAIATLIIVMPDQDDLCVLDIIRHQSNVSVIVIARKPALEALRSCLTPTADDYVGTPFEIRELLLRIRARLKGSGSEAATNRYSKNVAIKEMTVPYLLIADKRQTGTSTN